MDLLLRELRDDTGAFIARELSGDKITLGCGNDQLIQLLGTDIDAAHLIITPAGDGVRVKTNGGHVEVNGERTKSASLSRRHNESRRAPTGGGCCPCRF